MNWEEIRKAQDRLSRVAHRTPVLHSRQFDSIAKCTVYFKAENLQRTGSFKFRGACNKITAEKNHRSFSCIAAYSSGNHAQAVALAARLYNIPAVIVMPEDAPAAKIHATKNYGAEIVFYNRYTENREEIGRKIAIERNALLVPPYDDPLIIAGQGTAAAEFLEEIPDLDALIVPISGGGLISGCAIAAHHLKPDIRVYGVEPVVANDTFLSLQAGHRVQIDVPKTIADGLQAPTPGERTFPIIQRRVEKILLVTDEELIRTLLFVLERMKILVEPSGIASAAAVLHRKENFVGKRIGVILSGGNLDLSVLKQFLNDSSESSGLQV